MDSVLTALAAVAQPGIILVILGGTAIGIIVGAMPGLGSVLAITLALPLTFVLGPEASIALLLGLYFFVFDSIGFLIGSLVFVPVFAALLGFRRPLLSIVFAFLFVSALWFVFADVFIVRPPGPGYDSLMESLGGSDG